jgi:hypothetical protein
MLTKQFPKKSHILEDGAIDVQIGDIEHVVV